MITELRYSQIEEYSEKYNLRPGMGLAFPQIGINERIFVVVYEYDDGKFEEYAIVNPKIVSTSNELIAAEAEKKRKAECEALIQEAISLKTSEKYSEALKKVKKALDMNIAEKEGVIRNIKNEIEELKNKNSMTTRFTSWLNNLLDENN